MIIWHNPRCGKSREALKFLEAEGESPEIMKYLDTPPTADELKEVLSMLGMRPRELMRTKEAVYKELGLKEDCFSDDELIALMVQNPKLIERPIVIENGKAALGRPLQNVEAFLKNR